MEQVQYVCLVCGFNMIGFHPDNCPFCNSTSDNFITAKECSKRFKVTAAKVTDRVTCLRSVPPLGLEHSAYRVEAGERSFWIDSPSSFNEDLEPVKSILFTHHHFLGASNLYREKFGARVYIHRLDSLHEIARPFTFDKTFEAGFTAGGLEAFPIDGHTPGFTFYIHAEVLFICDYVFIKDGAMRFNPFGPADKTRAGGHAARKILEGRDLKTVCGFNYFTDFPGWWEMFTELLAKGRDG
ncbi:MAG: MBL fold metallo-hydrolase [Thermodesulfobacteriota bacterium]